MIFTSDAATLAAAAGIFPLVALSQPLNALAFVWDGILLGAQGFRCDPSLDYRISHWKVPAYCVLSYAPDVICGPACVGTEPWSTFLHPQCDVRSGMRSDRGTVNGFKAPAEGIVIS